MSLAFTLTSIDALVAAGAVAVIAATAASKSVAVASVASSRVSTSRHGQRTAQASSWQLRCSPMPYGIWRVGSLHIQRNT